MKLSIAIAITSLIASASGFSVDKPSQTSLAPSMKKEISRASFVAGGIGAFFAAASTPAFAKQVDDSNLSGVASQTTAKQCLDRCIYECTKNGKTKAQCTVECGKKCASADAQISSFTPGGKVGSE